MLQLLLAFLFAGISLQEQIPFKLEDSQSAYLTIISLVPQNSTKGVEFGPGPVQDDVKPPTETTETPEGPMRPPGFPGFPGPRGDRCGEWTDWQKVNCWWPSESLDSLPPACAFVPTKQLWPSYLKKFIAMKAMEKYEIIQSEYLRRGSPPKCGFCSKSFECRMRNETEQTHFCPNKEVRDVAESCEDSSACELTKENGGCRPAFFLKINHLQQYRNMINEKKYTEFVDTFMGSNEDFGRRQKRETEGFGEEKPRRRNEPEAPKGIRGPMGPPPMGQGFMERGPGGPRHRGPMRPPSGPMGQGFGQVPMGPGSRGPGGPAPMRASGPDPIRPMGAGPESRGARSMEGTQGQMREYMGDFNEPMGYRTEDIYMRSVVNNRAEQRRLPQRRPWGLMEDGLMGQQTFKPRSRQMQGPMRFVPWRQEPMVNRIMGSPYMGPRPMGQMGPKPMRNGPHRAGFAGPMGAGPRGPYGPESQRPMNNGQMEPMGPPFMGQGGPAPAEIVEGGMRPNMDSYEYRRFSLMNMRFRNQRKFGQMGPEGGNFTEHMRNMQENGFGIFGRGPFRGPTGPQRVPWGPRFRPETERRPFVFVERRLEERRNFMEELLHGTTCVSASSKCLCCCGHYIPNVDNGKCENILEMIPGINKVVESLEKEENNINEDSAPQQENQEDPATQEEDEITSPRPPRFNMEKPRKLKMRRLFGKKNRGTVDENNNAEY